MKIANYKQFRTRANDEYASSLALTFTLISVLLLTLLATPAAYAQNSLWKAAQRSEPQTPQIWTLPRVGPPTSYVLLQGTGFAPLTTIDVYFDSAVLTSTITDKNGSFGNGVVTSKGATFTRIQVPSVAIPGQHTITARERAGQGSAETIFLVRTDWDQFHFSADHAGFNPYENVLSTYNAGNLTTQWRLQLDGDGGSVAVANGLVYLSEANSVDALDPDTSNVVWKYSVANVYFSLPAVANGILYVGRDDGYVDALNANTGALLWQYQVGSIADPTVANGIVYIAAGSLWALDANTGALIWKYSADNIFSTPTVADGVVYFDAYYNNLYALNAHTGTPIWQSRPTYGKFGGQSPAVANGVVYVGDDDGLYAFDAHSGAVLWRYSTGGLYTTPAVANGLVYLGYNHQFDAVNATTGTLVWKNTEIFDTRSSPVVANGVVYLGGSDLQAQINLFVLDASTGTTLGHVLGMLPDVSPVVVNGRVYTIGTGLFDYTYLYSLKTP